MNWLSIIMGGIPVIGDAIKAWSSHDQKKQDVDLEKFKTNEQLDEAKVKAELIRLQVIAGSQDTSLGGRTMRYVFVYPLGAWWTAIIIDSIFHQMIGWTFRIGSAPILETWGGWMIAYLFFHSTVIEGKK